MASKRISLSRLISDVRIAIDENAGAQSLVSVDDEDTLLLDESIRSFVLEAVRQVEGVCSPQALDSAVMKTGAALSPVEGTDGAVTAIIPTDCMRLVAFRLSDWSRPVTDFLSSASQEYAKARSPYASLRGTPERPRAFIVRDSRGLLIEAHSTFAASPECTQFAYVPYPTVDTSDSVDIATDCYDAVKYRIAALVLQSRGETALAQAASQLSASLVP